MSKEKLKPIYGLRNYLFNDIDNKQNNFLGQVLTIIDASISDKEQRKGIKDLIKNEFYRDRKFVLIREILLNYCKQYCPDTVPDTKGGEDSFLGIMRLDGSLSEPEIPEWNFEK